MTAMQRDRAWSRQPASPRFHYPRSELSLTEYRADAEQRHSARCIHPIQHRPRSWAVIVCCWQQQNRREGLAIAAAIRQVVVMP
ncbi:MAG: hypothetical protein IGR92_03000 [Leptolyngbyaceae cyanobacterium T60_A2020_046]|nr:hypothetical protein [Leptolyngbyaceae cyanobacterium T60_A2020_046]